MMQGTNKINFKGNKMTTQTKRHNKLKPINPETSCKHMILRNMAEQITYLEEELARTKHWVSDFWNSADANNPESVDAFRSLNYFKNMQRDFQKQLRNLRYIQKAVKLFPDDELTLTCAKDYSDTLKVFKAVTAESKPKKSDSRKIN